MSRFKTEFTVKQHTPMIHFQSDQYGATLRATELKPKLDKFLIKYAFGDNFEEYKTFLIGYDAKKKESDFKGKKAFDYKIRIQQDISSENKGERDLYFGNMDNVKHKYAKKANEPFDIVFFTFHENLKGKIEEHFEAFLSNINFGTRQSKGYGSFYIDNVSFNLSLVKHKCYSYEVSGDWEENTKLFYQFLRQGVNIPTGNMDENNCPQSSFYCKPSIFSYAKKQGWTWEKKIIKQNFFNGDLDIEKQCRENSDVLHYQSEQKYLLRDLFGLSSHETWQSHNEVIGKKHTTIKRFKSPITFKPIKLERGYKVYFWADDSVDAIFDKTFTISSNNHGNFTIDTPPKKSDAKPKGFNFDDFFKHAFEITLSMHIDKKYQTRKVRNKPNEQEPNPNYKMLKDILDQLRRQV